MGKLDLIVNKIRDIEEFAIDNYDKVDDPIVQADFFEMFHEYNELVKEAISVYSEKMILMNKLLDHKMKKNYSQEEFRRINEFYDKALPLSMRDSVLA